ncbi:hypothetical protein M9H77_31370 [Catharanthus roseus]|uniref:Uncharacterized protein n=1 Tax=Catharanthus roseus TaxID=4058 RepID=A0ACC0A293_CATRO|nr:hypothetical protein M9H77_31370 [Catharanthus roseus]
MDDPDSGEWIHLKRGVDRGGCGLIGLRGHRIMLCGGVQPPSWSQGKPGRCPKILGMELWFESLRKDILVRRGTQIPYSAPVELVAGLGMEIASIYHNYNVIYDT